MFYCNECGAITEGTERAEQIDGFFRPYMTCGYCGSDDLQDASKCIVCGEYFEPGLYDVCDDCLEDMAEDFWQMFDSRRARNPHADWGNIIEGMAAGFEIFYNKYRFK